MYSWCGRGKELHVMAKEKGIVTCGREKWCGRGKGPHSMLEEKV